MKHRNGHPLVLLMLALAYIAVGGVLAIVAKEVLEALAIKETIPGRLIQLILQIALITVFYGLYLRKWEGRGLQGEYPGHGRLRCIAAGLMAGSILILVQVAVLYAAGSYRVLAWQPTARVLEYLLLMVMVGFLEELITRGVIFRLVEKWAGSVVALAVVSVEGALTHATNPNSTLWSSVAVGLEFGVLISLIYMATRNLWTVSALHFAWNFTMGGIFGINVSGTEAHGVLTSVIGGPAWLTGGAFGIEAGTPAVILTILLSTYLSVRLKRSDGFKGRE